MSVTFDTDRVRETAVAFAGGALILCASLTNFLTHNAYPVFRPEVAIVTGGLLCIACLVAPFYAAQRRWGRSFLEGLLALIFVDLNSDSIWLGCLIAALVGLVSYIRRFSFLPAMIVIGTVVLASKLVGFGDVPRWIKVHNGEQPRLISAATEPKPTLVHIILDEHIGVEGIPAEDAQALQLKRDLATFYLNSGFVVYGRAFSQHMHTVNAIPHILNYGRGLAERPKNHGAVAGATVHLKTLMTKGYHLAIFQSDFVDFCTGLPQVDCVTYDSSSLRPTLDAPLNTSDRAALIAYKFASLSEVVDTLATAWNIVSLELRPRGMILPFLDLEARGATNSVGGLAAMDAFAARMRLAQPGHAYFAHFLAPHYPYVVRSDCSFLPRGQWEFRRSATTLAMRRHAYFDQVRCTMAKVRVILSALSESPAGRKVVVIVHGDHGSRITKVDPNVPDLGRFTDDDMIAGFSTLFAIHAPGIPARYIDRPYPAATLLQNFAQSDFKTPPTPRNITRAVVYLDDWQWKAGPPYPMPRRWFEERPASGQLLSNRVSP